MTGKIMSTIDLSNDPPPGICHLCAQHGVVHDVSQFTACWCQHTANGAVRGKNSGWQKVPGISRQDFKELVTRALARLDAAANELDARDLQGEH